MAYTLYSIEIRNNLPILVVKLHEFLIALFHRR